MKKEVKKSAPKMIAEERIAMDHAKTPEEVDYHFKCACAVDFEAYSNCLWRDCRYCKTHQVMVAALERLKEQMTFQINGGNVTININK